MGTEITYERLRELQENQSVIIKDVPKEDDFSDSKRHAILQSFLDDTARSFVDL